MPNVNLDGPNGHILISMFLTFSGVALLAFAPSVPAEVSATILGAGLGRLERSLQKAGDGE